MLITSGVRHKRVLTVKRRIKAPDFHATFGGSIAPTSDFNLDAGISNPDQNAANPQWDCPAYPEGCTYYTQTEVNQDKDKMLYSPVFQGTWSTYMQGQPMGSPVDLADALNAPTVYGLQAYGETTPQNALTRRRVPYEVRAINGSLFTGIRSALQTGNSVSFASAWYESFEAPVNGIVSLRAGDYAEHNWKFCGVKIFNGTQYLIAKPWLGPNWGDHGFCYFSQEIVDSLNAQAFTLAPVTADDQRVVWATVTQTIITYINRLLHGTGSL